MIVVATTYKYSTFRSTTYNFTHENKVLTNKIHIRNLIIKQVHGLLSKMTSHFGRHGNPRVYKTPPISYRDVGLF